MNSLTNIIQMLVVVTCLGILAGCDEDADNKQIIKTLLSGDKSGPYQDHWLEQLSIGSGKWHKIALIFATYDDYEECGEMAKVMGKKYPMGKFRCVPAD